MNSSSSLIGHERGSQWFNVPLEHCWDTILCHIIIGLTSFREIIGVGLRANVTIS